MDRKARFQLAELCAQDLDGAGVRPHTTSWVRLARLFEPIFERDIPARRETSLRGYQRTAAVWGVATFAALFTFAFALPFDLFRLLRARARHREAMTRLAADDGLAADIRAAARLVCVDFRVERDGRAVLRGTAIGAVEGDAPRLVWVDAHLGRPPADAPDAQAVAARVASSHATPPEVFHWVWPWNDETEVVVRESCPW